VRKRRRSYDIPGHAHELTFSCYRGLRMLASERTGIPIERMEYHQSDTDEIPRELGRSDETIRAMRSRGAV
jgi:hypothetical protein